MKQNKDKIPCACIYDLILSILLIILCLFFFIKMKAISYPQPRSLVQVDR